MPYGKKSLEIRKAFLRNKSSTKKISDYISESEKENVRLPKEATIFDIMNDPFEMCDPTTVTRTKIDMNKLRRMKK